MIINANQGGGGNLQEKTATPSTAQQVITPDNQYDGLSKVTIAPTPLETITVKSSTVQQPPITPTSPNIGFSSITVEPNLLQTKSVPPSSSVQNITPDSGYYGLSSVSVGAAPVKTTYGVVSIDSDNKTIVITCNAVINKLTRATYICNAGEIYPANTCIGFTVYPTNDWYEMVTYKTYDAVTDGYFENVTTLVNNTIDGTLTISGEGTNVIKLTPSKQTIGSYVITGTVTVCAVNYV